MVKDFTKYLVTVKFQFEILQIIYFTYNIHNTLAMLI